MVTKKKKPTFNVMNYGFFRSVKERWRKPRGNDNKKRIRKKFAGASPRVGYRNPLKMRHLHPLGRMEKLVRNLTDLQSAKNVNALIRIGGQVGGKKRSLIISKAKELKLEILNE